jgi:transcription termination factor Rho
MSAVLDIDNLLESPLSDLHAIAGELDIEGYRLLKKSDLTIAILQARGAVADQIRPAVEAKSQELERHKAEREQALADAEEAEQAAREEARTEAASERARGGRGRGSRGGRGRGASGDAAPRERSGAKGDRQRRGGERGRGEAAGAKQTSGEKKADRAPERDRSNEPTTPLAGVFEPGSGGGGRLRTDLTRRVRADADVPRGEVRRWNLQRGDLLNAQVRTARRGRTDFVVAGIDSVNGLDLEARKQKTPSFEQRDAAAIAGRYAKKTFKHVTLGAGSRLVVTGPTRAAASQMLKQLAGELASAGVVTTLVVVSARPEQSEAITGVEVVAGDATKSPDDVVPALELALERDKRLAESGRETALLVDGLDLLDAQKAAEIFNAARNLAQGGALTVAAAAGAGSPLEAQASAIAVVAGGRKLKLDKKSSWSA